MSDGCETAISRTGWGLCHYFIIGVCGLCSLAEASASLLVFVVTPLLACDLKFDKSNVATLNAIFSLGMAAGGFLFGTLADTNGRKSSIPMTMVVIFCGSIGLSFARKLFSIGSAIFLLGIGVAGNNVILRVYLIECLPAKHRGTCLALLDLLWVLGYLSALGISWSLVPSVVRMLSNEFRPSSWRVLAGLGGAPSLIMACAASLLPPSPRYLLYRRRPERALVVLQMIYAINNSGHVDHFPVPLKYSKIHSNSFRFLANVLMELVVLVLKPCELEGCIQPEEIEEPGRRSVMKSIRRYVANTLKRIGTIFHSPYTRISILAILSRLFLFPGLVWLAMWKSHVSSHLEADITGEQKFLTRGYDSTSCIVDAGDIAWAFLRNCQETNNTRFEYSLLLSMSYIIGEGLLFFGIETAGRRLSLVTSGMIGGTSILALIFATRYTTAKIVLSIFFLTAYSIIYTTTSIILLENFPTSVRGTVAGLTLVLPHLAGFFVKFFARIYCVESVYVATALIIGATLTSTAIPDLTGGPMRER